MTTAWDPDQYERYKAYRDRPALDLMLQIPSHRSYREIWDLGCGTGEHAALLKRRHPDATVHGLDTSPAMLAKGRARPEQIDWVEASIADWTPAAPPDLIFTNAALQWLGEHETLVPRLVESLAPGGVFACQMPQSYDTPWHVLLRETAEDGPWADRMAARVGVRRIGRPEDYYGWLQPLCAHIDIWSTTYLHALTGEDPIVDWMLGTALRPYVEALTDDAERAAFLDAYRARLKPVFPRRTDGTTLLPFPRLFLAALRRG
ncbi:MAG: methyltransferase domain-containing protein [Caulobacteraceae bacterium]|nr:methyltransferase domain-containing protein [Caulobacteraceae bacterium]